MPPPTRIIPAIGVAALGILLAWRALDRGQPASEPTVMEPTPEHVAAVAEMASFEQGLAVPTRTEVPEVLAQVRQSTLDGLRGASSRPALSAAQKNDLADAVVGRLGYLYGEDYAENIADLVARGWEAPDAALFEERQSIWAQYYKDAPLAAIDASAVTIRPITRSMFHEQGGLRRPGFGLTEMIYDNQWALGHFDDAEALMVEVAVPMQTQDINGRAVPILRGFVMAWDAAAGRWRPLRMLVHYADFEADAIPLRPFI